ncbi:MAG: hypothetical protein WCG42_00965 [Parachlamydiaceae bacterium]
MKEHMVRLSFDIPEDTHFMLKTECVQARLSIKDFAYSMILKGIKELKEEKFKKRLKQSIDQSKKGKARVISAAELDEMVKDEE